MNRRERRKKNSSDIQLPKTRAEMHHMLTEAQNEGAAHALQILLYVLLDKFGWDTDQLCALMDRVADQARAVTEGYITVHDIHKVLRDEYHVEI